MNRNHKLFILNRNMSKKGYQNIRSAFKYTAPPKDRIERQFFKFNEISFRLIKYNKVL